MSDELKQRFFKLWNELGASNPEYEYNLLKDNYSRPKRYYHTLSNHIPIVLKEFDSVKNLSINPVAVELGIWYHDAIYDPMSLKNEEQSAELLLPLEYRAGVSHKNVFDAYPLVIATTHKIIPNTIDEKIIMDCDIASLGKSKKEFDANNYKVWQEYSFVPPKIYAEKRIEILLKFLEKPFIYQLDFFRDRYENQARENLKRLISDLEKSILY